MQCLISLWTAVSGTTAISNIKHPCTYYYFSQNMQKIAVLYYILRVVVLGAFKI
jgi:hypothetical protein